MGTETIETSNCYFLMGVFYIQNKYYIKALACMKKSMNIRIGKLTDKHECVTDC